jgi:DNA-binding MarR family transcriptional regulator
MASSSLIGFALFRLAEYFTNYFVEKLVEKGITDIRAAHITVFRELEQAGSRITDMAARAGITKQSMSALVEHLEGRGYIMRVPDPKDGRARLVRLTRKGERIYRFGMRVGREVEARWQSELGSKEFRQLRSLLTKLDNAVTVKAKE